MVYIVTRSPNWKVGMNYAYVALDIEDAEAHVESRAAEDPQGEVRYVYRVEATPVKKFTTVHQVHGETWDGE